MTKQLSDSERLMQITLNRKYLELEEKDRTIKQLGREIEVLKLKIKEDKDTINQLCKQVAYLSIKQRDEKHLQKEEG